MSTGSPTPFGETPLTGARVLLFCPEGAPLTLSCPYCEAGALKGIDMGPDLRTVTVRCSECGGVSVITISE